MPRILLVRHAQSEWNAQGRWQGSADPPLSAQGEEQADTAGAWLAAELAERPELGPVTSLWSSDLRRATATAERIAAAVGWVAAPILLPRLREHDVGLWSGLTRPEIAARWPGMIDAWAEGRLSATPGGESRGAFDARVREGIRQLSGRIGPGLAVVVSHGGVLRAIARWLGLPPRPIANLDGYLLSAAPGGELTFEADVVALGRPGDRGRVERPASSGAGEAL